MLGAVVGVDDGGGGTLARVSWAGQCERGTRRGCGCAVGDGDDKAGHCNVTNESSCLKRKRKAGFVVLEQELEL